MKQIVLASNNQGKLREFAYLTQSMGLDWHAQSEYLVPDIEEPYGTFLENALLKARHASKHSGLPALADDSGLCVPILNGAPGVFSARYATQFGYDKSDSNNNHCLLNALKDVPLEKRHAFYVAVLVFVLHEKDPCPLVATGIWQGQIALEPQGENGFGYDPLFFLPDLNCTAAQLHTEEKNAHSHRAKAIKQLIPLLKSYL